jgi:hypothetical protein
VILRPDGTLWREFLDTCPGCGSRIISVWSHVVWGELDLLAGWYCPECLIPIRYADGRAQLDFARYHWLRGHHGAYIDQLGVWPRRQEPTEAE